MGKRSSRGQITALALLLLSTALFGCSSTAKRDRRPYRFAQGMIDPRDPLAPRRNAPPTAPRARARPHETWRLQIVSRCERLIGSEIPGPRDAATRTLLERALGPERATVRHLGVLRLHGGAPRPGDLVIFDNGHDANRNRRMDDPRSDAGIVTRTRGQAIDFVYLSGSTIRRGTLHLSYPHRRRLGDRIVNSYVRVKQRGDEPQTAYLAAELLAGFAIPRPAGSDR